MHIGTLTIVLYMHDNESLKDKRQVVKSLVATTRQKFNVSIAEVDDLDKWRRATLGVAAFANRVLDKVLDHIEGDGRAEVGEVSLEML